MCIRDRSKAYKKHSVLKDLNFVIEENKITGLIGRNGVGKTTLMKLVAGFIKKTGGQLSVFGENPFNSLLVSANSIYIDDQINLPNSLSLHQILEEAECFYKNWNRILVNRLFEYYQFNPYQAYDQLSKGKKSTFNMIIAIGARCPLTLMDEPTTGMDAGVRKEFYRILIKDYIDYPRTILLSGHHLEEMEDVLEDILLIDEGKIIFHKPIEEVKTWAIGLQGKKHETAKWTNQKRILYKKNLGMDSEYIVVENNFSIEERQRLSSSGIVITPVSASDACLYAVNKNRGRLEDVFK